MFISREDVLGRTGQAVTIENLRLAQMMVETYVGKDEVEVEDATDLAILAKATAFQAVYVRENSDKLLEQAAIVSLNQNDSVVRFDPSMFAPFMSPWAIRAFKGLSWFGSRAVRTGPMMDTPRNRRGWAYE